MNVDNTDPIIDSRDVIARIEEIESEIALAEPDEIEEDAEGYWSDLASELDTLKAFAREGEDYCEDWVYGAPLIRESYFEEYAEQLADDIGAIDASASWPVNCIDWAQAARELQMDYTPVDFDGVTYWTR